MQDFPNPNKTVYRNWFIEFNERMNAIVKKVKSSFISYFMINLMNVVQLHKIILQLMIEDDGLVS